MNLSTLFSNLNLKFFKKNALSLLSLVLLATGSINAQKNYTANFGSDDVGVTGPCSSADSSSCAQNTSGSNWFLAGDYSGFQSGDYFKVDNNQALVAKGTGGWVEFYTDMIEFPANSCAQILVDLSEPKEQNLNTQDEYAVEYTLDEGESWIRLGENTDDFDDNYESVSDSESDYKKIIKKGISTEGDSIQVRVSLKVGDGKILRIDNVQIKFTDKGDVDVCPCEEYCSNCDGSSDDCKELTIAANNPIDISEEFNILLILDESETVQGNKEEVINGVKAFVDGLLCQEAQMAVMEFSKEAEWVIESYSTQREVVDKLFGSGGNGGYFGSNASGPGSYTPSANGSKNWMHALYTANQMEIAPDLVLFFTSGSPTSWGGAGCYPWTSCTVNGGTQRAEVINATIEGNKLKGKGSHIFMLGTSNETDFENDLQNISGSTEYIGDTDQSIANTDYSISQFSNLVQTLEELVSQICLSVVCTSTDATCSGANDGKITASASGGRTPYSYSVNGGTDTQNTGEFTGLAPGDYTVTITDANGRSVECEEVTVGAGATITCTATPTDATNSGADDGSISASASGGAEPYSYSINGGTDTQDSGEFTGLTPGDYTVTIVDENGCSASCEEVTVGTRAMITCTATPTDATCSGADDGRITVTAEGGQTPYEYSIDTGQTYQPENVFDGLAPGKYAIMIKDGSGCTTTCEEVNISQSSDLSPSASPKRAPVLMYLHLCPSSRFFRKEAHRDMSIRYSMPVVLL